MIDADIKKEEIINLFLTIEDSLLSNGKADELKRYIEKTKLPDSKTEEWKNTNIDTLLKHIYKIGIKSVVPDVEFVIKSFSRSFGIDSPA